MILASPMAPDDREALDGLRRRLETQGTSVILVTDRPERPAAGAPRATGLVGPVLELPCLECRWTRWWHLRRLVSELRAMGPRLLHARHPGVANVALTLADRLAIPYLLTVDSFLPPGTRLALQRSWCRGVIATGDDLARDLVEGLRLPTGSVTVIRPGIAAVEPKGAPQAGRQGVPVVGACGPLASGSGLVSFLHAARSVLDTGCDAEFLIVGRGPGEPSLRRLAARLRIADRLSFASDAQGMEPYWSVLTVFCLTTQHPTTGIELARALAAGLPSIATAVSGLDDWFRDGSTGLRVPVDDAEALAAAIRRLLSDPDLAARLAQAGRDRVRQAFDPEVEARSLQLAYEQALAGGPRVRLRTGGRHEPGRPHHAGREGSDRRESCNS